LADKKQVFIFVFAFVGEKVFDFVFEFGCVYMFLSPGNYLLLILKNMIMKNTIGLIGRFAVLALCALLCEGLITFGAAFNFDHYNALAWIVQVLIFCTIVWGACEWHFEVEYNNK
jgi:hypothetical protein